MPGRGGAGSPSDLIGVQKVGWDPSRVRQRTPSPSSAPGSDIAGGRGADERRGRQRVEPPSASAGLAGAPSEQLSQWARGRQCSPSVGRDSADKPGSQWSPAEPLRKWPGFDPRPRQSSPSAQQRQRTDAVSPALVDQGLLNRAAIRASTPSLQTTQPPPPITTSLPEPPSPAPAAPMMASAPASPTPSASCSHMAPSTPAGPGEMSPEAVAQWLGSMSSCIPNQVLTDLRTFIVTSGVGGTTFAAILNAFKVEVLEVENLSPMHLSRLRKAWHADFPRSAAEVRWPQQADEGLKLRSPGAASVPSPAPPPFATAAAAHPAPACAWQEEPAIGRPGLNGVSMPGEIQASSLGGSCRHDSQREQAQTLAIALNHLAAWADFDCAQAVSQLSGVLPQPLIEDVFRELSHLPAAVQRHAPAAVGRDDRWADAQFGATFAPSQGGFPSAFASPSHVAGAAATPSEDSGYMRSNTPTRGYDSRHHHFEQDAQSYPATPTQQAKARRAATPTQTKGNRQVPANAADTVTAARKPQQRQQGNGRRDATYVAAWVRSLPTTQVPEQEREALAMSVEDSNLDGDSFTKAVGDPAMLAELGVPNPARAMKLRKAWDQVLREDACRAVAIESAKHSAVGKGVRVG